MGAKKYLRRVTMQLEQLIQATNRATVRGEPLLGEPLTAKLDRTTDTLDRLNTKVERLADRVETMATRLDHLTEALTAMQAITLRQAKSQAIAPHPAENGRSLEASRPPTQIAQPLHPEQLQAPRLD